MADITPPLVLFPEYWLAGFADGAPRRAEFGKVYAKALALHDGRALCVVVSADILGFTRRMHRRIAQWFGLEYGLKQDALLLAATHTHSGPVLTDNLDPYVSYNMTREQLATVDGYTTWLEGRITKLIEEAVSNLRVSPPVLLSYGVGDCGLGLDRIPEVRDPLGSVDRDLPVLTVRTLDNRMVAILFSYAAHPVELIQGFSPQWPGEATAILEAAYPGCTALFMNGCAGNINADHTIPGRQGLVLAEVVREVIDSGSLTLVEGPIETRYMEASLPLDLRQRDSLGAIVTTERLRVIYQDILERDDGLTPSGHYWGAWARHAEQMIDSIDAGSLPRSVPLPVQVWRFGRGDKSVRLLALGGEMLVHYALYFKADPKLGKLWVVSYANEVPSYIPWDGALNAPTVCTSACISNASGAYEAGWRYFRERMDPVTHADVTSSVADGSMLFYGWPCRYRGGPGGVETHVKDAVTFLLRR